MKKIVFFTFISLLLVLFNGCGKNSSAVNHSGMHMHNTENIAGHAYVEAKFTYAQTNLHSKQNEEITIKILDIKGSPIQDFEIAHEKLMHFIVVSKDLSFFEHIHPEYQGNGVFKVTTQFPTGGDYKFFAEFVPKGEKQAVVKSEMVSVIGEPVSPTPLEVETKLTKEVDDKEVTLVIDHMMSGMDLNLTFGFKDVKTKKPIIDLQPYLGAVGHVIIISEGAESYLHVHPTEGNATGPDAKFMTNFPKGGIYKIWGQFQHNGKTFTVPFTVKVP